MTDFSKIENQIGCGYCMNENTCSIRDPKVNNAKLGCKEFLHFKKSEFIPCPDCNGEGGNEVSDCTAGSASVCCGGCTRNEQCSTCNGAGEIENINFEVEYE